MMKHDNSGNIYLNLKRSNNTYVAVVLQTVDLKVGMLIVSWLAETFIFKIESPQNWEASSSIHYQSACFSLTWRSTINDGWNSALSNARNKGRSEADGGVLDLTVLRILESRNQIMNGSDTNRTSVDDLRYNSIFSLQFEIQARQNGKTWGTPQSLF